MANLDTTTEANPAPVVDTPSTKISVPVTKGGKTATIEIDTAALPDDVYREVILQGLKTLVNRGTSKITKETYPDQSQREAAAMAKAQEQVELIMTSKIKFTGGKAKKASGAVMTEARRLAKLLVKQAMKEAGIKVSHVEAKEITKAANEVLDANPDLIEQAKANLAERDKTPIKIDVKALVQESPELIAKAEAKKAKDKAAGTLSKTQAGKAKTRAKPQAQANA